MFRLKIFLELEECTDFGACSATCGDGLQSCDNICHNAVFGKSEKCPEESKTRTQKCNIEDCPVTCEWIKVYEQTGPSRFAKDGCTLSSCDVKVDDENFINFDQIKNFDQFYFKFEWDDQHTMTWEQVENPLSANRRGHKICILSQIIPILLLKKNRN